MEARFQTHTAGLLLRLAAGALIGFGGADAAWAQAPTAPPQPVPTTQLDAPVFMAELPGRSQVFPDGGFPASPAVPAGGIPTPTGKPGGLLYPAVQPPTADYAPPGFEPRGPQEAPGVPEFYRPKSNQLPEYDYQPSYYDRPGVGARPIADYAPPGYVEREWHDAPGAPEFTPIFPPVPITDEERQKFVTRGLFPGSYLVPGTDTSVRFRGFVRITGLYDFNPIGSRDDFVTNTIPVPQTSGQNANVGARFSRIGLDTWTPTPFLDWNVHTFIEGDFFNGPAQAVGGGGNPFRLRFAFIDFGYFRVGQQNSVFQDNSAFPSTVDFAGPRGLVNLRRPTFRVTVPLADQLFWAAGIEQPFSDITTNGLGVPVQNVPDFATHLRYETGFGSLQLSGVLRTIGYQPLDGDVIRREAWGVSASAVFHPWAILLGSNPVHKDNPTGLERSRILLQYTIGQGIGRYIQDTAALGLDGQVNPTTGAFNTPYVAGWSASYEHWFTEKWLANLTYSGVHVDNTDGQPSTTYNGAHYVAISLWYIPFRNMSIGIEYVWGERENLDVQWGHANRFNGLVQYNF
jgi:DcaP outer membrane protein